MNIFCNFAIIVANCECLQENRENLELKKEGISTLSGMNERKAS